MKCDISSKWEEAPLGIKWTTLGRRNHSSIEHWYDILRLCTVQYKHFHAPETIFIFRYLKHSARAIPLFSKTIHILTYAFETSMCRIQRVSLPSVIIRIWIFRVLDLDVFLASFSVWRLFCAFGELFIYILSRAKEKKLSMCPFLNCWF